MKETILSSVRFFLKIVIALVAFGWMTYDHAESFVVERINKSVAEVKNIREEDMKTINRQFHDLKEINKVILQELINRRR